MALNSESRTKNAGKNAISSLLNKIIILCLTFISRKFFIRYIGVEYLGINGLFSNVLTLLSMADLGLGTAMNVSLYKPISENDEKKISALLNYFRKLYYVIAVAVFVIGTSLLPFLKFIVKTARSIDFLGLYYMVYVVKNVVSYLFVYKSAIIKADQRNYLINRVDVWVNIIKVIAKIVVVIAFRNYLIYILLDVIGQFIHNFVVSFIADKNYSFIKNKEELAKEEKKVLFTDISSVFIYKISGSLLNGTDNILISVIVGTVYVGVYSNYHTITNTIQSFIALLFSSLTASVGNLVVTSNEKKRYMTFKSMQMVSFWLCGIVTICLYFLMQDFIQLCFGPELLLDKLTLIAIVINVFFSNCMRPVWTFREGTGMYRQIRYIMLITAVLNLILSIVLGKCLGVAGILFATSISKLCTYFWYEPNVLFKTFFKQKPTKYYLEYLLNIIVLLVCTILCWLALYNIKKISVLNWFIKGFICFIIINVIYFFRYFKTVEFKNIKQKVLRKFKMR